MKNKIHKDNILLVYSDGEAYLYNTEEEAIKDFKTNIDKNDENLTALIYDISNLKYKTIELKTDIIIK